MKMDKVIHIGAGTAVDLDGYLAAGAKEIVLVEPLPAEAHSLRQLLAGPKYVEHNIKVLELAVATELQADQLFEYNAPSTASLRQATGLKALFPGLKILAQHTVDTVSPEQFIQTYKPAEDETALLVIQAPGEVCGIVQALIEADLLKSFGRVSFTANPEPFYAGSKAAGAVLSLLEQQGYEQFEVNEHDPDWPSYVMQRSPLKDTIDQLETQLKQSQNELAAEQQAHKETASALNNQLQQSQQEQTELGQQLAQQEKQLDAKTAELQKVQDQHAQTAKQLEQARKALTDEQQASTHAQEALAAEQQTHKKNASTLETQLKKSQQQQAELDEQLAQQDKQLEQARKALTSEQRASKQAQDALAAEQNTHQETVKKLEEKNKQFINHKHQAESLLTELSEIKNKNEKLQKEIYNNEKLNSLENKIANLGTSLTKHIDKQLATTNRQIEDTIGLQNYFNTGKLPLSFQGWPISADLALYLTGKLETENYDLIIEFGSGSSTVLFAKVLMHQMQKKQQVERYELLDTKNGSLVAEIANTSDLPKHILTFEHNKHYYEQTAAMLKQAGVEYLVNLSYSPLIDFSYQGEDYLYYDCDKELEKIAEIYEGRALKILVLVDGPPGSTCLNARFPALPKLINKLPKACFEIILDDYKRSEEKKIVSDWIDMIEKRSIRYKSCELDLRKGAFSIIINKH